MKAAWFEKFGSADKVMQVGEQPKPLAEPGQVVVKLAASGVNPSDVKKRAGASPNLLDEGLVIPHSDGAGIIESVGSGVSEDRLGERSMGVSSAVWSKTWHCSGVCCSRIKPGCNAT